MFLVDSGRRLQPLQAHSISGAHLRPFTELKKFNKKMMFQNLRTNSQLYILHKNGNPYFECGTVINITGPKPKYPMSPTPLGAFPQMEMVVDIVVNIGGQQVPLKDLKANADIDDNGTVIVSCSKDAINSEVALLRQKSMDILNSVDYHKNVITCCDKMLNDLNPEIAAKRRQDEEMKTLKEQMADLMEMNRQLMAKLTSSETSASTSRTNKKEQL